MFFCDPPGRSDPESLNNYGDATTDCNYILMHDQEPIHLDIHRALFQDVQRRNQDLNHHRGPEHSAIITSELDSDAVNAVCEEYGWKPYYYFFHGWAALDWYRGYHRTWLMNPPEQREILHAFVAPNRIIGGRRDHRVLLLYHLFKMDMANALISAPKVCPHEGVDIVDIGGKFKDLYSDIESVLAQADLPKNFPGETGHPMHSCWLSLFDQCNTSLAYVVTETVYFGRRWHLTEKTFKPICQQMPFVLVSTPGSLEYLRRYGFKTFDSVWDESYDCEVDDFLRLEKIAKLLNHLNQLSSKELQSIYQACIPIVQHNHQHFYHGNFEGLLWRELSSMLDTIKNDF